MRTSSLVAAGIVLVTSTSLPILGKDKQQLNWVTGIVTEISQDEEQDTDGFNQPQKLLYVDYTVQVENKLYVLRLSATLKSLFGWSTAIRQQRSPNIALAIGETVRVAISGTSGLLEYKRKQYSARVVHQTLLSIPASSPTAPDDRP